MELDGGEEEAKDSNSSNVLGLPVYFKHLEISLHRINVSYKAGASTEQSKSTSLLAHRAW